MLRLTLLLIIGRTVLWLVDCITYVANAIPTLFTGFNTCIASLEKRMLNIYEPHHWVKTSQILYSI